MLNLASTPKIQRAMLSIVCLNKYTLNTYLISMFTNSIRDCFISYF